MRKALIAVAVATVLFAVGAFAAQFAVNTEDIASGTDTVDRCADEVDVDFTTVYDNAGDWNVTGAVVKFYSSNLATTACAGFGANLAVMTTSGTPAATGTATVGAGASTVTVSLTPGTVKASAVTSAAVLVDGKTLQVNTPGNGF